MPEQRESGSNLRRLQDGFDKTICCGPVQSCLSGSKTAEGCRNTEGSDCAKSFRRCCICFPGSLELQTVPPEVPARGAWARRPLRCLEPGRCCPMAVLSRSCTDQGRLEIVATTLRELEQQEQAQRAARAWDE